MNVIFRSRYSSISITRKTRPARKSKTISSFDELISYKRSLRSQKGVVPGFMQILSRIFAARMGASVTAKTVPANRRRIIVVDKGILGKSEHGL